VGIQLAVTRFKSKPASSDEDENISRVKLISYCIVFSNVIGLIAFLIALNTWEHELKIDAAVGSILFIFAIIFSVFWEIRKVEIGESKSIFSNVPKWGTIVIRSVAVIILVPLLLGTFNINFSLSSSNDKSKYEHKSEDDPLQELRNAYEDAIMSYNSSINQEHKETYLHDYLEFCEKLGNEYIIQDLESIWGGEWNLVGHGLPLVSDKLKELLYCYSHNRDKWVTLSTDEKRDIIIREFHSDYYDDPEGGWY
jgi:hypothetical protein